MKTDEIINQAIKEFLALEISGDASELNYASKIQIVQKRVEQKLKNEPKAFGIGDATNYEYEMFFSSNPNDLIKIDGWLPIGTNMIQQSGKIEEYLETGLLRKIKIEEAA